MQSDLGPSQSAQSFALPYPGYLMKAGKAVQGTTPLRQADSVAPVAGLSLVALLCRVSEILCLAGRSRRCPEALGDIPCRRDGFCARREHAIHVFGAYALTALLVKERIGGCQTPNDDHVGLQLLWNGVADKRKYGLV